jgi:hypothetical protein
MKIVFSKTLFVFVVVFFAAACNKKQDLPVPIQTQSLQEASVVVPRPDHTVIVILENHGYPQIIGSSSAPYINSLAAGTNSTLCTQSFGIGHPSQPNYLELYSGSNQGVTDDNMPVNQPFTSPNLGMQLINAGFGYKTYSENLPSVGYNGATSGAYARKHNPAANWMGTGTNQIPTTTNQPFTAFPTDFTKLPTVSSVVPNQNNDMHNGSISTGDTWVKNHLDSYVQWAKTHNSLLILTFDEDNGGYNNHIATIFAGQMVNAGQYTSHIDHYNVLKTIEDMYILAYAGNAATSTTITGIWNTGTSFNVYYRDADADSYGNLNDTVHRTTQPAGYVIDSTDCNDNSAAIHPGATEVCNGIDDNCNGQIDEGVKTTFYRDADGDGYGNSSLTIQACSVPTGYVTNSTDCNDSNSGIHPGATEICDGIDNDCDGQIDKGCSTVSSLSISDTTVNESAKQVQVRVYLSKTSTIDVRVNYTTVSGTATAPKDYKSVSGILTIPAGSFSAYITIRVSADKIQEPTEYFYIQISNPVNATINRAACLVSLINL